MKAMTGLCSKVWDMLVCAHMHFAHTHMCVNVFGGKERVVGCLH